MLGRTFSRIAAGLDLGNAIRVAQMGLRENQLGGILGAYFRGAKMPPLGRLERGVTGYATGLQPMLPLDASVVSGVQAQGWNPGRAGLRMATAGLGGMAAASMLPRNDAVAAGAGAGAFAGVYGGLGAMGPGILRAGRAGQLGRGALGLAAGSMMWSGLRSPQPADYAMRG
jgi:hypothetical protein